VKGFRGIIFVIAILVLSAGGWWQLNQPKPQLILFPSSSASTESAAYSSKPYAAALAKYVNDRGMVNYRGLKTDIRDLDAFAASLAHIKPEEFDPAPTPARIWPIRSDRERLAFWINAYNALTLEAIIRNYPIQPSLLRSVIYPKNSIRQIPGVWDKLRFVVVGREMTLNDIEHGTLRAKFNEPRIHVALVCAAMSCPPLRNEPYTTEKLDEQLDDQARTFLRSPRGLRINREEGKVYLSSIFKWFGEDFVKTYGTTEMFAGKSATERAILNFVSRYVEDADRDFLLHGSYKIEYLDYDWSLNEQAPR
jgi:hypothetical protein